MPSIQLGSYTWQKPLVSLAPMAGVADVPFQEVARQWGADITTGEMLTEQTHLWHVQKSQNRLRLPQQGIKWVQLVGTHPQSMAAAGQKLQAMGVEVIDINFGCPAKKVVNKAAGSALMAEPERLWQIVRSLVTAVDIPVTAKMRLGVDADNINAVEIAQGIAEAGAKLLAVHGRTRADKFTGSVNYEVLAEVVQKSPLPVLVNGDLTSAELAQRVWKNTQAAGVMIGRGALGRPWLLAQVHARMADVALPEPSLATQWCVMQQHLARIQQFYVPELALRMARKHLGYYTQHWQVQHHWALPLRQSFYVAQTQAQQSNILESYALQIF